MGLIDFLKKQGFIEEGSENKKKGKADLSGNSELATPVSPTYFPITEIGNSASSGGEPSFVAPLQQNTNEKEQPDPNICQIF